MRNTAGDRFDPPVMADWATLGIRLKFWRPGDWFGVAVFDYLNRTNNASVQLGGRVWPAYTLRVKKIDPKPVWDQVELPGTGTPPVKSFALVYEVGVELLYDPGQHDAKVLDAGRRKKVTVSGATRLVPLTDAAIGAIVADPMPLNGAGTD